VSKAQSFITPLGPITVDQEAVEAIAKLPFVDYLEQAHTYEHSLEVHLPFLQEMLDDFKIVPLLLATHRRTSQSGYRCAVGR